MSMHVTFYTYSGVAVFFTSVVQQWKRLYKLGVHFNDLTIIRIIISLVLDTEQLM